MKLDELLTKDKLSREETERLRNLLRQLITTTNQPKQDVYTKKEVDALLKNVNAARLNGYRVGNSGEAIPLLSGHNDWSGGFRLVGKATVFDDLRIEPVARTTGANAPTFEKWYDDAAGTSRGVYLYSFDDANAGSEKEVFFTMQLPHAWKTGIQAHIDLHVHWVGAVDDTSADPRWGFEYAWKNIGQVYGDTTTVYATTHHGGGVALADITANTHYISEFAAITPDTTQDKISGIMICRLFRDSANAGDTYNAGGAKCGLLYVDAHIEINSLGSREEYIK